MLYPGWSKCGCGRLHWTRSASVAGAALARCRANHVRGKFLKLRQAKMTAQNSLVVLLSHEGARHHHRRLAEEWKQNGFGRQLVKYGFSYKSCHGPTKITGNRLTMYNWRFRWLPAICTALEKHQDIRHVIACENNASFDDCNGAAVLKTVNATPDKDIHWLGYIKVHPANKSWFWGGRWQIQGSKVVVFSRTSLFDLYEKLSALNAVSQFCHHDLWLSRQFQDKIAVPKQSMFGVRRHHSTSCADTKGVLDIARKRAQKGFRVLCRRECLRTVVCSHLLDPSSLHSTVPLRAGLLVAAPSFWQACDAKLATPRSTLGTWTSGVCSMLRFSPR